MQYFMLLHVHKSRFFNKLLMPGAGLCYNSVMAENILSGKTKSHLLAFFLAKPYRYFSEEEIRKQLSGRNLKEDLAFLSKHDFILVFSKKASVITL